MLNPYDVGKPFFISEIGINGNGKLTDTFRLIDMAKDCGCHAVKFQKRTIDVVYTKEFLDSPRESPWGKTQRDQKEGLEYTRDDYNLIDSHCRQKGMLWFASAWDLQSQLFLQSFDVPFNKIASAMVTHDDLVEAIAVEGKHTFISTGGCTTDDIIKVTRVFHDKKCPFTLMHCVSIYPCPDDLCNIARIPILKNIYDVPVGYSGHEVGVLPSVLAVLCGAVAIERHITLDRSSYGSDQSASLEHEGLQRVVRDCSSVASIMGSGTSDIHPKELDCMKKLRYW